MKITDGTDVTVVTVINKKWHWQDHARMLEVHISKHSLFRLKMTVGCLVCACGVCGVCVVVCTCGVVWCVLCVCVEMVVRM